MSDPQPTLPAEVAEALARGNKVEAIKLLRAATGMSLASAKGAVEGRGAVPGGQSSAGAALPAEVQVALAKGDKIEAIRLLRATTGMGLKEAKDSVDAHDAAAAPERPGLAPGEVPRSMGMRLLPWLVAAAALAGAWIYLARG